MIFSLSPLIKSTGRFDVQHFTDGEINVRLVSDVKGKNVWVVASTAPPADNLLKLLFLLDALRRNGARINLFLTYFGYARQDRIIGKEAFAGKLVCDWIRAFKPRVFILDMHSERLSKFLKFKNVVPYELMLPVAKNFDVIVSPDKGRSVVAKELAKSSGKPLIVMEKIRPKKEHVKMLWFKGDVKSKRCLISDDMISTGNTIIRAADTLLKNGAKSVSVIATHGVFSPGALDRLSGSQIEEIYTTDSLPQFKHRKLVVIGSSKFLKKIMR